MIAPISDDGSVCLFTWADADMVVDIAGWFEGDASNGFVGRTPKRFVDTRDGNWAHASVATSERSRCASR